MHRTVCFTIDVEPDFGGLSNQIGTIQYYGISNLPKLETIVNKYQIRITAFVTGKTLEDNPEVLDYLKSMRAEIEQHSYSHEVDHHAHHHSNKIKDIEKGLATHEKILGKFPLGYRAPQGIITKEEALFLRDNGILFDSSIFPTFFPGRFNRLSFPVNPFFIDESGIMEIPFTVIPRLRVPIGLSYMQLAGFTTFKALLKFCGMPELIIYDFHTYELGQVVSFKNLPTFAKLGYYRSQKMYRDPADVFERFVDYILARGYKSKYMADVYKDLKSSTPIWRWTED